MMIYDATCFQYVSNMFLVIILQTLDKSIKLLPVIDTNAQHQQKTLLSQVFLPALKFFLIMRCDDVMTVESSNEGRHEIDLLEQLCELVAKCSNHIYGKTSIDRLPNMMPCLNVYY